MKSSKAVHSYSQLRMEGYFPIVSPLLYLTYAAIGLAMLLGGDFNRRGQLRRISVAVTTVLLVQVATLGAKSIGEKIPEFAAALFVIPIVTTILFIAMLASSRPKRRNHRIGPQKEMTT